MSTDQPTPAKPGSAMEAQLTGFTMDQCRAIAEDAKEAREQGHLRPMAEFDPERILWLIDKANQLPALRAAAEKALALADTLESYLSFGSIDGRVERQPLREKLKEQSAELRAVLNGEASTQQPPATGTKL